MNNCHTYTPLLLKSLHKSGAPANLSNYDMFAFVSDFLQQMHADHTAGLPIFKGAELMTDKETRNALEMLSSQVMLEATYWRQGVILQVPSLNLAKALLNCEADATIEDAQLPFPTCEIQFPKGLYIADGAFELGGVLLTDRFDTAISCWSDCGKIDWVGENGKKISGEKACEEKSITGFTQLISTTTGVQAGYSALVAPKKNNIITNGSMSTLVSKSFEGEEDVQEAGKAMQQAFQVCFALCMYLQTAEGQAALTPVTGGRSGYAGLPAKTCKKLKKKKHFLVRDLITEKLLDGSHKSTGTGSERVTHWRRLHLRALRSERFKRNPDGSTKVVWVKPTLVNASKGNPEKTIRVAR